MTLVLIELTIQLPTGLHARPAAQFVKTASRYPCAISLRNLSNGTGPSNAKSIMSVLSLGIEQGARIALCADGEQADEALAALRQLLETDLVDWQDSPTI